VRDDARSLRGRASRVWWIAGRVPAIRSGGIAGRLVRQTQRWRTIGPRGRPIAANATSAASAYNNLSFTLIPPDDDPRERRASRRSPECECGLFTVTHTLTPAGRA